MRTSRQIQMLMSAQNDQTRSELRDIVNVFLDDNPEEMVELIHIVQSMAFNAEPMRTFSETIEDDIRDKVMTFIARAAMVGLYEVVTNIHAEEITP